jgi:hypothetical protein
MYGSHRWVKPIDCPISKVTKKNNLRDIGLVWSLDYNPVFCSQNQKMAGPTACVFVWCIFSLFGFKDNYCATRVKSTFYRTSFLCFFLSFYVLTFTIHYNNIFFFFRSSLPPSM